MSYHANQWRLTLKTLTELKAENAANELAEQAGTPTTPDPKLLQVNAPKQEEQAGTSDDPVDVDADPKEVPDWMQTDTPDEDNQDGSEKMMPVRSHVKQRKGLKSELKAKDSTIQDLQEQINKLSNGGGSPAQTQKPTDLKRPRLSDFDAESDPESAYETAILDWSASTVDRRLQQHVDKRNKGERDAQISQALDKHYIRAATVVDDESQGLTGDGYRDADEALRLAADNVQPGQGDNIINTLLANIGAGSEKVVVSLYQKPTQMNQFITALREDPSGIKVSMLLARMAAKFERDSKQKQVSNAPAPGKALPKGTPPSSGSASERKLKKNTIRPMRKKI